MTLLAAAHVLTADGVREPGWLECDGGVVTEVGSGAPPRRPDETFASHWLAPGFVDLHVHGGGGATFTTGDPEQARAAAAFHRAHGTTTLLASLVSAPVDALAGALDRLRPLVDEGVLAGLHLEGPFLNAARRGAHDARHLRAPAAPLLDELLAAAGGALRMVTLAPELDGGLEAVARVADAGVIAAVGHTDADYPTTRAAVGAGARVATHLGNGMRGLHHREPGPVPALLEDDRVVVELIADGVHLHPVIVRAVTALAGPERVALVTDAIAAAGAPDGRYELGGLDLVVAGGVARLAEGGSLAGSTLTLDAAVRTAVAAGVSVPDALRAATSTPARALGLHPRVGTLARGCAADLVVLDDDLGVERVMAGGEWVAGTGEPWPR